LKGPNSLFQSAVELEPATRGFRQNLFLCGEQASTTFHDGNAPLSPLSNLDLNPLICYSKQKKVMWVEVWVEMKNAPKGTFFIEALAETKAISLPKKPR